MLSKIDTFLVNEDLFCIKKERIFFLNLISNNTNITSDLTTSKFIKHMKDKQKTRIVNKLFKV